MPSEHSQEHLKKIDHATNLIKITNPPFNTNMQIIRNHLGRDWKRAEKDGSYEAWDKILLAYYEAISSNTSKKSEKHVERVPLQAQTCKGKIPYNNVISAIAARDRLMERDPNKKFNVYICLNCGEYHVGGAKKEQE
jgi:hypothetical protein